MFDSQGLFYQFKAPTSQNPIQDLKDLLLKKRQELPQLTKPILIEVCTMAIKNLEDFLKLADTMVEEGTIQFIEKTNIGTEGHGTHSVLLIAKPALGKDKQDTFIRPKLIEKLYKKEDERSKKAFFMPMLIPYMYAWEEEGTIEVNDYGTFINDILRGFVKINENDFNSARLNK